MDEAYIMGSALDSWITGDHLVHEDMVRHKCPRCGEERDIRMLFEGGRCFYIGDGEDLSWCEDCDVEMDII